MFRYKQEKYKREKECAKHSIAAHVIAASKLATSSSSSSSSSIRTTASAVTATTAITTTTESLVQGSIFPAPAITATLSRKATTSKYESAPTPSVSGLLCSSDKSSIAGYNFGSRPEEYEGSLLYQIMLEKNNKAKQLRSEEEIDAFTRKFLEEYKKRDLRDENPPCWSFADLYHQYGTLAFDIDAMRNAEGIKAKEEALAAKNRRRLAKGLPALPSEPCRPLSFMSCGGYVSNSDDDEDALTGPWAKMFDATVRTTNNSHHRRRRRHKK